MTAPWYTPSAIPVFGAGLVSATMRSEFLAIQTALDKLPAFTGNANKVLAVNAGETAVLASTLYVNATTGSVGVGIAAPIAAWGKALSINADAAESGALELAMNGALAGYMSFSQSAGTLLAFNLFAYANIPLVFGVNNAEVMRLAADGRISLGVGGVATAHDVAVRGTTNITGTSQYAFGAFNSLGDALLQVRNDGATYTGTRANSPYNLTTASAANVNVGSDGVLARSTSSIKYKKDVETATGSLEKVMALRPVKFRSKSKADGNRMFGGLIAEEVHDAGLGEYVEYNKAGEADGVMYSHLVALAFGAIQELNAKVDALGAK